MVMTPMDAWHIISANLAHLVRLRRCNGDPKGFVPADTEAEVIAFKALQEMQDRVCSEPLMCEELLQMDGEPVWLNIGNGVWGLVDASDRSVLLKHNASISIWTLDRKAYRYKPAEVKRDV